MALVETSMHQEFWQKTEENLCDCFFKLKAGCRIDVSRTMYVRVAKNRWQKTDFSVGARKLNCKFLVKTFTRFFCLTTKHKLSPFPPLSHPLPTHILICLLKILYMWLWKNVWKNTKVKYAILQIKIVQ